ncbi:hypothetical protein A2U01_0065484, partial [Trifolium medium]|nr:hypothetical protein [Trifolium medium]
MDGEGRMESVERRMGKDGRVK